MTGRGSGAQRRDQDRGPRPKAGTGGDRGPEARLIVGTGITVPGQRPGTEGTGDQTFSPNLEHSYIGLRFRPKPLCFDSISTILTRRRSNHTFRALDLREMARGGPIFGRQHTLETFSERDRPRPGPWSVLMAPDRDHGPQALIETGWDRGPWSKWRGGTGGRGLTVNMGLRSPVQDRVWLGIST